MTGASGELVLAEHRGPVLVLTFNRPARLNGWTDELEDRYFALLDAAEDDADGTYADSVARAESLMLQAFRGADVVEGVAGHLEKRPPSFPPLPPVRSSDVPV
ncbi:hypothetical protein ACWDCB_22340 [Streptomyces sp. NPDC001178]